MQRRLPILCAALLSLAAAFTDKPCNRSIESLNAYEAELLAQSQALHTAGDFQKISHPLRCIFEVQQNGHGAAKYMAEKYLNPLLGAAQVQGLPPDPRYREIAAYLERLTLQSEDPLSRSVVAEYSRGDWGFYELFCEQGDTSFCPAFLPDSKLVSDQQPLLAAASLMRLRKAYQVLKGKPREEVAQRLRELYRDIPTSAKLKRQFIDQIYNELFKTGIPLGMA